MTDRIAHASIALPGAGRRNGRTGDDRATSHDGEGFTVFALADGATGVGRGWKAAETVMRLAGEYAPTLARPEDCKSLIGLADALVLSETGGQADTTAIVFATDGETVWGASAGDSRLVVFGPGGSEPTARQVTKPRVGSGCEPVSFEAFLSPGQFAVAASDGLWDNLAQARVRSAVEEAGTPQAAVEALVEAVSSANGGRIPEDLSVIVVACRAA